jgi:hypothetical protein
MAKEESSLSDLYAIAVGFSGVCLLGVYFCVFSLSIFVVSFLCVCNSATTVHSSKQ